MSRTIPINKLNIRKEVGMKIVNLIAVILLVIGGLNWGLVGLFNIDLVATIFGYMSLISRIVYILVGLSAIIVAISAKKVIE
jgi:uncharacterized membrane protein YuzA (DUF378 family)